MDTISLKTWIVEDDVAYQDLLISYLELLGHQAHAFFSGEACLKELDKKPDVVLLDHDLGSDLNGIDILRKIKVELPDTFVIYISAQEKISTVSEAYRHGADDYIGKDSASLIRLKLKLEKIHHVKNLKMKKRKRVKVYSVAGIAMAVLAVLATLKYFIL